MLNPLASTPANRSEPISDVSRTKGASFLVENLAFFGRKSRLDIMTSQTEQLGLIGDEVGWMGVEISPKTQARKTTGRPPRALVPS